MCRALLQQVPALQVSTKVAKPIFGSPLNYDCINPLIGEKGLHLLVMKALLDFSEKKRRRY